MSEQEQSVESLRNLGPASANCLQLVGIGTIDQLREAGAVQAFLAVKQRQRDASLNLLWAIAAGLQNRDWRELSHREKENLLKELTQTS